MTAKENAVELRELFFNKCNVTIAGTYTIFRELSKDIAIAAVDEIIKVVPFISTDNRETVEQFRSADDQFSSYWEQVRSEITNL